MQHPTQENGSSSQQEARHELQEARANIIYYERQLRQARQQESRALAALNGMLH